MDNGKKDFDVVSAASSIHYTGSINTFNTLQYSIWDELFSKNIHCDRELFYNKNPLTFHVQSIDIDIVINHLPF